MPWTCKTPEGSRVWEYRKSPLKSKAVPGTLPTAQPFSGFLVTSSLRRELVAELVH